MRRKSIIFLLVMITMFFSCKQTIDILFDANGGEGGGKVQTAIKGDSVLLFANEFTKEGYTFAGWNTKADGSGNYFADKANYAVGNSDVTLFAIWTQIMNTVLFHANGGVGANYTQKAGQGLTVVLTEVEFTKENFIFIGWSLTVDGDVQYLDKAEYTMGGSNVDLYAVWGHKIIFNVNGGAGVDYIQKVKENALVVLKANSFTKEYGSFLGWSLTEDGDVEYVDKAKYAMGTSDITLYAVWKIVVPFSDFEMYMHNSASSVELNIITVTGLKDINLKKSSNEGTLGHILFSTPSKRVNLVLKGDFAVFGNSAFSGCSSLETLDLSGCAGLTSIGDSAFSQCSSLTSIGLSGCAGLTSIGNFVFSQCSRLISIDLSDCVGLKSLGTYAFSQCSSLISIDLSDCTEINSIESDAFDGCGGAILYVATLTIKSLSSGKGIADEHITTDSPPITP